MRKLLPNRSGADAEPRREAQIVDIADGAADEVFSALSSTTSRQILSAVYEVPMTPSEIAEDADTSLQNVRYHLDNLLAANLVEVVDTCYSRKGNEMKVYGPTSSSLVLFAGEERTKSSIRNLLKRLIGVIGLLGIVSLFLERGIRAVESVLAPEPVNVTARFQGQSLESKYHVVRDVGPQIPPGVLFFTGGMFVLAIGLIWIWHQRRGDGLRAERARK